MKNANEMRVIANTVKNTYREDYKNSRIFQEVMEDIAQGIERKANVGALEYSHDMKKAFSGVYYFSNREIAEIYMYAIAEYGYNVSILTNNNLRISWEIEE